MPTEESKDKWSVLGKWHGETKEDADLTPGRTRWNTSTSK